MPDTFEIPGLCGSLEKEHLVLMDTTNHPIPTKCRLVIRRDSGTVIISRKGVPIEVCPPKTSDIPKKQQKVESNSCIHDNCRLIGLWSKGHISYDDMSHHLHIHHSDQIFLDPC